MSSNVALSPPHMMVSAPLTAPAWPPETGASMNCRFSSRAARIEFARHIGRGGGVVDEDRAGLHAGEGAVRAQHHAAQVVVVADTAEHDLRACRGFARRGGGLAAEFGGPGLRLWLPCGCRP